MQIFHFSVQTAKSRRQKLNFCRLLFAFIQQRNAVGISKNTLWKKKQSILKRRYFKYFGEVFFKVSIVQNYYSQFLNVFFFLTKKPTNERC